ncbi:altronate hydrolase [Yoonia rosea]|uniref:Altronate hydrolase n=1 Tax=Yoonia rosea TaxID=287098 RepID=A0A1R3X8J9_9RHOB|nr:altronate dehydratase family protein [Yoonia rosea]SIT87409.1 altronate hydrolase [Yoonia rosea]
MPEPLILHPNDTVAVLTDRALVGADPLGLGAPLPAAVASGHKIARVAMPAGAPVIKFGQFIGRASVAIAAGEHVHTHNCAFADRDQDYAIGADLKAALAAVPQMEALRFAGYARADGRVGTRNYIALVATVNCSATVIRRAATEIEASGLLADYHNVDGIVALAHGSGCGMADSGRGFDILNRVLWGHATHPNVGATVFVGLGCEVMQIARMQAQFGDAGTDRFHALTIQDTGGTRATIDAIKAHVTQILPEVNAITRSQQPMSALRVALQCGGSDGFSSITANPALGIAADLIVAQGGTAILSETPEIYGAEQLLLRRASSRAVADKLIAQIRWWEDYAAHNGGSMDNNPSPGNKQGGITTILEKSLGAVAKAGATPLMAVYDYAEQVAASGFVFMDTPGYDPVSATGQIAGGAQIVVFTTGRGSAFGSKPAPTIKLATSDRLFKQMPDDMDLNTGDIMSDGISLAEKGHQIFDLIRATASGQTTKSEALGLGDNEFVPWQIGAVM